MTIRTTSIAAFRSMDVTASEAAVLRVMKKRKDWTGREIAERMRRDTGWVSARLCGLKDKGKVVELGRCRKNKGGRSANVVRVANN